MSISKLKIGKEMGHQGFTFVELVLVMTLLTIVFRVTSIILLRGLDSYQFVVERTALVERVRFALDRMTREFQLLETGEITNVAATSIQFVDDQSGNADFTLDGTNLMRGNDILCPNVTAFALSYFDASGNITAVAGQVRRVRIDLTAQGGGTSGAVVLQSEAYLRGIMYDGYF